MNAELVFWTEQMEGCCWLLERADCMQKAPGKMTHLRWCGPVDGSISELEEHDGLIQRNRIFEERKGNTCLTHWFRDQVWMQGYGGGRVVRREHQVEPASQRQSRQAGIQSQTKSYEFLKRLRKLPNLAVVPARSTTCQHPGSVICYPNQRAWRH